MLRHADRDETGYVDDEYDAPEEETWDAGNSTTYWRRRFLILCGGVAALGVCAWLFPGAHHGQARPSAAASASMAALARQQSLPPAATGRAWAPPTPTPPPSSSPAPSPSPSATANKTISRAYRPASSAAASGAKAGACAPADLVLSLFSSQPSYAAGDQPGFSVYAVSTAAAPCMLPYGAGSVRVLVTRRGEVVWDSAACKPAAAKPVRFSQGVPQLLTMTWNRHAAGPAGCAGSLPAGGSGTFDAVAMRSGGQSSPVTSFKIR